MASNKISKTFVSLKPTDVENPQERSFEISRANVILRMNKSNWELSDDGFTWNGIDIVKVKKASKETKDTK